MPTEKPRYTITLDEDMLKKIDDFRFENRFPNRTQATLELIRLGIEKLESERSTAEPDIDRIVNSLLDDAETPHKKKA